MDSTKPWYQSKAVWGGIIAALAGLGGMFGFTITEADQLTLAEVATATIGAVGGLLAVFGRVTASRRIGQQ